MSFSYASANKWWKMYLNECMDSWRDHCFYNHIKINVQIALGLFHEQVSPLFFSPSLSESIKYLHLKWLSDNMMLGKQTSFV